MNNFQCEACGICCTKLDRSTLYQNLDSGNGTCIYFNKKNKLCKIYKDRSLICRVDRMYEEYFNDEYSKEEYYRLNYDVCKRWQENKLGDDNNEQE